MPLGDEVFERLRRERRQRFLNMTEAEILQEREEHDDILAVRMWVEIGNGIPKEESVLIRLPGDEELWDAIKADMEAIWAKGGTADSGIRMREDNWTPTGEWIDPDE